MRRRCESHALGLIEPTPESQSDAANPLEDKIPVLLSLTDLSFETRERIADNWRKGILLPMDFDIFMAAAEKALDKGK